MYCVPEAPPCDGNPADHTDSVGFPEEVVLRPIGVVRSPYKERYGTPRQAPVRGSHRPAALEPAQVVLFDEYKPDLSLRDLEEFDRVWLLTALHLNDRWAPLVRPLGAASAVGACSPPGLRITRTRSVCLRSCWTGSRGTRCTSGVSI